MKAQYIKPQTKAYKLPGSNVMLDTSNGGGGVTEKPRARENFVTFELEDEDNE